MTHWSAELMTVWLILGVVGWLAFLSLLRQAGAKYSLPERAAMALIGASFGALPFLVTLVYIAMPSQLPALRMALLAERNEPQPPLWRKYLYQGAGALVVVLQGYLVYRLWSVG